MHYKEVEKTLCEIFLGSRMRPVNLRARLQHFQRIGLTPSSPGRGKVIDYTEDDLKVWAVSVALANIGLPPLAIHSIVRSQDYTFDKPYLMVSANALGDGYSCKGVDEMPKDLGGTTGAAFVDTGFLSRSINR